jgi:hypothetical protein
VRTLTREGPDQTRPDQTRPSVFAPVELRDLAMYAQRQQLSRGGAKEAAGAGTMMSRAPAFDHTMEGRTRVFHQSVPGLPGAHDLPQVSSAPFATGQGQHAASSSNSAFMGALSDMTGPPPEVKREKLAREQAYRLQLQADIDERRQKKEAEQRQIEAEKRHELMEVMAMEQSRNRVHRPLVQQQKGLLESPDLLIATPRMQLQQSSPQAQGPYAYHPQERQQQQQQHAPQSLNDASAFYPPSNPPQQFHSSMPQSQDELAGESVFGLLGSDNHVASIPGLEPETRRSTHHHQQELSLPMSGEGGGPRNDSFAMGNSAAPTGMVSLDQFKEVSELCRELIREQKELRRALEEKDQEIQQLKDAQGRGPRGATRASNVPSAARSVKSGGARTLPRAGPGFGSSSKREAVEPIRQAQRRVQLSKTQSDAQQHSDRFGSEEADTPAKLRQMMRNARNYTG